MENRWRPEGWRNPYLESIFDVKIKPCDTRTTTKESKAPYFEAGANAMLAAMRKRGIHSDMFYKEDTKDKLYFVTIQGKKGTLVFIPDDE